MDFWQSISNGVSAGVFGTDSSIQNAANNAVLNNQPFLAPFPLINYAKNINGSGDLLSYLGITNSGKTSNDFYYGNTTSHIPEYIDAPLAHHYGMDVSTAYQEALANTATQRKVRDLQAAGLNPVLAAGNGSSGASVFSGSTGSGSGSGSVSGSNTESSNNLLGTIFNVGVPLLAGAAVYSKTGSVALTSTTINAASQIMKSFQN